MGIEQRPYVGTWQLSGMNIVQHAPDALVYINGDVSIPGCYKCNSFIDIQKYVVNVSVDASNDPSGASANISLSIPRHSPDSISIDANYILKPGLEVHIYMKGYFPVQGQFRNVPPEETGGVDISKMITYPYYHVFHGVVTQVDFSYNGGFRDATLACNSMLYFWQYQNIAETGAYFGARPTNKGMETSLVGNRFNGWSPYSIVYAMYADVVGAAGSVAFALKDKTNVAAKDDYANKSLYSMSIDYWNERFKQKMINLRMHGASGEVLTTAQAIFLSRLNGKQVKALIDSQYGNGGSSSGLNIFSAAKSLGLIKTIKDPVTNETRNYNPVTLLDAVRSPNEEGESGLELNFANLQAFTQELNQFGTPAFFETTYESKLDIINKVLETTGWEFYQDVDGDFVFKPPMYNLDTRGSHVYVIRAVDIISMNQTEKEPECTYVTTNNNHFQNLKDMGTEGEWGVRGQYIDYRLVAQFGWRPFSFESNYLTDEQSLFYNAVTRLDVQNVGINSASLTIPIRPELRPGYPVYIEPYDCFYYVTGISHSMSYGGQCTTNLTLTAKRSKFFAPGDPNKRGIDSIDMEITTLPPKPLEILDNNGNPKLQGFPNVVMALDPNAMNPMYFSAGFDLENISDPTTLKNLLRYASEKGGNSVTDMGNGSYKITFSKTENVELTPDDGSNVPKEDIYTFSALLGGAEAYYNSVTPSEESIKLKEEIDKLLEKLAEKTGEHFNAFLAISTAAGGDIPAYLDNKEEVKKIAGEINKKYTELKEIGKNKEGEIYNNKDAMVIKNLITKLEQTGRGRTPTEDFPNPSATANMLSILSEKKTMLSNDRPGHYRYFSCSHPTEKNQGQATISAVTSNGGGTDGLEKVSETKIGFVNTPVKPSDAGYVPEAELGEIEVSSGFRISRSDGQNQVVTTDRIQTMVFAKHSLNATVFESNYKSGVIYTGLTSEFDDELSKRIGKPKDTDINIKVNESSFKAIWDKYTEFADPPISFPSALMTGDENGDGYTPTSSTILAFSYIYFPQITAMALQQSDQLPPDDKMKDTLANIKLAIVGELRRAIDNYLQTKWHETVAILDDPNITKDVKKDKEKEFSSLLKKASLGKGNQSTKKKKKEEKEKNEPFYSPVFPVSDGGGYTVIGGFRYGRGLQVFDGSSLEDLASIDPLKYADPQAVENYILSLQGMSSLTVSAEDAESLAKGGEKALTVQAANLINSIKSNSNAPEDLRKEIDKYNNTDLSNWMSRIGEGVNKVPVSNAAVFLSNISPDKKVCTCRSIQADVYTEAFATDKFLRVIPTELDELSKFQSSLSVQQSLKWRRIKNALAGEAPDSSQGNVYQKAKSLGQAYTSLLDSTGKSMEQVTKEARDSIKEKTNKSGDGTVFGRQINSVDEFEGNPNSTNEIDYLIKEEVEY